MGRGPLLLRVIWSFRNAGALIINLVAERIHFALLGIRSPALKLKVYTFGGLSTQQLSKHRVLRSSDYNYRLGCLGLGIQIWVSIQRASL